MQVHDDRNQTIEGARQLIAYLDRVRTTENPVSKAFLTRLTSAAIFVQNLHTRLIQAELDVIKKILQESVPICSHSLSGRLSEELIHWVEVVEKTAFW